MQTVGELITPVRAARLLCLPTQKLLRLARAKAIPHVELPTGEIRFRERELWEWVESFSQPVEQRGHADD